MTVPQHLLLRMTTALPLDVSGGYAPPALKLSRGHTCDNRKINFGLCPGKDLQHYEGQSPNLNVATVRRGKAAASHQTAQPIRPC